MKMGMRLMKHQTEISKDIGYSQNYMSTFRSTRKVSKTVNSDGLLKMYFSEKEDQDDTIKKIQDIVYALEDTKKKSEFCQYLVKVGVMFNHDSFNRSISSYFADRYGLISRTFIIKTKKVIEAYLKFMEGVKS